MDGTQALDHKFIRQVNQIALTAAQKDLDPFGALLVKDDKIVFSSIDQCINYSDPTAHAELVLISEYCRKEKIISLEGYSLYSNVEPCVMCSGAIHWSRLSKVVFSVSQSSLQGISQGKEKSSCHQLINTGNLHTQILGPTLEEEGLVILNAYPFKSKKQRHKDLYAK